MRYAELKRKTNETDIDLKLTVDGSGIFEGGTGCGFLDHMLTLLAKHAGFDISITCKGDTQVDFHHTTEDIGITLGKAFSDAMGDKRGIKRYASMTLPMDEALVLSALDVSGRAYFVCDLDIKASKVGDFDTELVYEFWQAVSANAGVTLHIRQLAGFNAHHIIECVFKSVARSLREACSLDERFRDSVPSTKGAL